MSQPTIETSRLLLRPFVPGDAADVQRLAGDHEIAATTLNIPHPYADGMAEEWIASNETAWNEDERVTFAVTQKAEAILVGACGIRIQREADCGELGYWIGKEFWGRSYATEAAEAVMHFGFTELSLNRLQAQHFSQNPASGRIMQKLGMSLEGTARQAEKKWGSYVDIVRYALLRDEWQARNEE